MKKYNVDVGLICCADGGTGLDRWKAGELLFDNAVFNAKSLYEFGIRYFKEYENFEMGERIKEHSDYNDEFRTKMEML